MLFFNYICRHRNLATQLLYRRNWYYNFIFNQLEATESDHTSASTDWYQIINLISNNVLNSRLADVQLGRLRFWSYARIFTLSWYPSLYLHLQQTYNLVHYLLNCLVHQLYIRSSPPWRLQTRRSLTTSKKIKISTKHHHHPTSPESSYRHHHQQYRHNRNRQQVIVPNSQISTRQGMDTHNFKYLVAIK